MDSSPKTLSPVERLLLQNQFLILAKLDPEQKDWHEERARIVEHGFANDYHEVFTSLREGMTEQECDYVADVLEMYGELKRAFNALEDKEDISEDSVTFSGFDGNNESSRLAYSKYLKENGKFNWVENLGTNSHGFGSRQHPAMVDRYLTLKEDLVMRPVGASMTADEIKYVLG